jgi:uncharacterized protein (TIGR00661 family)
MPGNKNLENNMAQAADGNLRRKCRILVAPLDWGLGHSTRCIPIMKELLANGCEVWLAGEGQQEALLKTEFPELPFLSLEGYRIQYSRSSIGFFFRIIMQVPRIISVIKKEHRWLKNIVKKYGFDAVISDNRFGLYHEKIPCIFITHQLKIKNPRMRWSENIIQKWNYKYIGRFSECWVPDVEQKDNLAGELSRPAVKALVPIRYVGILSRLEKKQMPEVKDHLLFILSGPEPQRSILENKIINEVSHYARTATVVRGLPSSLSVIPSTGMIKFYNHLSSEQLNEEIEKAGFVISRSGYSTVMDLVKLQKRMILVPTPGQTEQEYLASYLYQKQIALAIDQDQFSLDSILERATNFNYNFPRLADSKNLEQAIEALITTIKNKKPR